MKLKKQALNLIYAENQVRAKAKELIIKNQGTGREKSPD
jgi:hypothetical protein